MNTPITPAVEPTLSNRQIRKIKLRQHHINVHWLQPGDGRVWHIAIHHPHVLDVVPSEVGWRRYHTAYMRLWRARRQSEARAL